VSGSDAQAGGGASGAAATARTLSVEELADLMLYLQDIENAENINLVTGAHFLPQIARSLELAKAKGLKLRVVYNSGGYEEAEAVRRLDGLVDIYLPDLKCLDGGLAERYMNAPDYPQKAVECTAEMFRQTGECSFDERGMLKKGVIVRHLLIPGHVKEAARVAKYLHGAYGDGIYMSFLAQYTPCGDFAAPGSEAAARFPELARRVTKREYSRLIDAVLGEGIVNAYVQERESACGEFVPAFGADEVPEIRNATH